MTVRFTSPDGIWFSCRCGWEKWCGSVGAAAAENLRHRCGEDAPVERRKPRARSGPPRPTPAPVMCPVCFTAKSVSGKCLC